MDRRLVLFWDSENCAVPARITAADALTALSRLISSATGSRSRPEVRLYHSKYLPGPVRVSARTWGAQLIDAGRKEGAVDIALKGGINDLLLDVVMAQQRADERPIVGIISGDRDFSDDLRRLRKAGLQTICVYNSTAHPDYASLADFSFPWNATSNISSNHWASSPIDAMKRSLPPATSERRAPCRYFTGQPGSCRDGQRCRYAHDHHSNNFLASKCERGRLGPLAHGLHDLRVNQSAASSPHYGARSQPLTIFPSGSFSNGVGNGNAESANDAQIAAIIDNYGPPTDRDVLIGDSDVDSNNASLHGPAGYESDETISLGDVDGGRDDASSPRKGDNDDGRGGSGSHAPKGTAPSQQEITTCGVPSPSFTSSAGRVASSSADPQASTRAVHVAPAGQRGEAGTFRLPPLSLRTMPLAGENH